MRFVRACAAAAAITLSLGLAACSGDDSSSSGAPSGAASSSSAPSSSAPSGSSSAATPSASSSTDQSGAGSGGSAPKTTKDQPVPKVQRTGETGAPTTTAKPASTDGTVKYSDGVSLKVLDVSFAKETAKGPGSFPGRQFAVLTLEISNSSKKALDLNTTVVTVLDKSGKAVAPVYADEAKAQDFSGTLKPGKTTKARYAFAVPTNSRSQVTVVVDFDGVHTSAVFRGKLA